MICFGFLMIFGEKSQKSKLGKSGHIGLLRRSVEKPTPQLEMPHRGKAKGPKWHPSGTPRRSYCS